MTSALISCSAARSSAAFREVSHGAAVRDDGDVGPLPFDFGDAQRDQIFFFRNLPFFTVKKRVLHHQHRVVVAYGGFHQTFRIVSRRRNRQL